MMKGDDLHVADVDIGNSERVVTAMSGHDGMRRVMSLG